MPKSIVYAFGPDGAGKSTVTSQLIEAWPHAVSFNGSDPTTWQDLSWHEEVQARGIDTDTLDPRVHMEAMRRCYMAANSALRHSDIDAVIIDSDLRAKAAVKATAWYGHEAPLEDLYGQLQVLTNKELDEEVRQAGLHVTVSGASPQERAALLMNRVVERGEASFYDPRSLDQSRALLEGCDELESIIHHAGDRVVRVETNQTYNPQLIVGKLAAALSVEP